MTLRVVCFFAAVLGAALEAAFGLGAALGLGGAAAFFAVAFFWVECKCQVLHLAGDSRFR